MTAEKFYNLAAGMQKSIDDKLRDRQTNTPKRQREARSAWIEGQHMARAQHALNTIGNAIASGQCPPDYAKLKKSEVLNLTRTKVDHPGYYEVVDTGEYSDVSVRAVAFRQWVDGFMSVEQEAKASRLKHEQALRDAEARIKFLNIPGFFPTPPKVADQMVELLQLNGPDLDCLEPSAGTGALLDAVLRRLVVTTLSNGPLQSRTKFTVIERNHTLCDLLKLKYAPVLKDQGAEVNLYCEDFLDWNGALTSPSLTFHRIIMNPPFEDGQDMAHIQHAYAMLKPGGILVSVCSPGPFFRQDKKAVAFREWFESVTGEKMELPDGAFKESGTGVKTLLLVIHKE